MSDRIKKLKSEARKMPRNPMLTAEGTRRLSVGTIGIRKIRRSSVKSNTSSGSSRKKKKNPFADLVVSQTKTSTIQPRKLLTKSTPNTTPRGSVAVQKGIIIHHAPSRPASPVIPSSRSPAQVQIEFPKQFNSSYTPTSPYAEFAKQTNPTSLEANAREVDLKSIPIIAPDLQIPEQISQRPRPSLVHGFVQEADEKAMESMAMDKIDRFLESLGGGPINHDAASDNLSSSVIAAGPFTLESEEPSFAIATQISTSQPDSTHLETSLQATKRPSSIKSWTTDPDIETEPEEESSAGSVSSARVVPPLSIRKSPTTIASSQISMPQTPNADIEQQETFRGVKVSWLIETYRAYMAEKAEKAEQKVQASTGGDEKISPASAESGKGLRPLLLPAVCQSPPSKAESTSSVTSDKPSKPTLRRTPTKLNFTFAAPRTSTEALKSPIKSPAVPGYFNRPTSMPAMRRSNTGLSQQDAVEVARLKMNSALAVDEDDYFVPQVFQPTALQRPNLDRGETVGSQYSAILPALPRFESYQGMTEARASNVFGEALKAEAPNPPSFNLKASAPLTPSTENSTKVAERTKIVANNVAFYDPFAASKDVSMPTQIQSLHQRSKTEDVGLATVTLSRIEGPRSPPVDMKRAYTSSNPMKEAKVDHVGARKFSSGQKRVSMDRQSDSTLAMPIRRLSRPSQEGVEDSTSSDDDLLPKMRPRFDGFGTSSKAQKLLGMTDSDRAGKKPDIKRKKTQTNHKVEAENKRLSKPITRPVSAAMRAEQPSLPRKASLNRAPTNITKRSSVSKQLVEPFVEEDLQTTSVNQKINDSSDYGVATIYPSKRASFSTSAQKSNKTPSPLLQASARTDGPRQLQDQYSIIDQYTNPLENRPTEAVAKHRPPALIRIPSRTEDGVRRLPSPLSREFNPSSPTSPKRPATKVTAATSPLRDGYFARDLSATSKGPLISPGSGGGQLQPSVSAISRAEPFHEVFGNYRLSSGPSPGHSAEIDPNSISPSVGSAQDSDPEFQSSFSNAQEPYTLTQNGRATSGNASTNTGTTQPGIKLHAPKARQPSRPHGRLSVIEQSPLLGSDPRFGKAQAQEISPSSTRTRNDPSVHGLGLGMSPTNSNAFDQILHERHSASPKLVNRLSTLDRINQSADPSLPKSTSSTPDQGDRLLRPTSRTSQPASSHDNSVPISYFQPRGNKQNVDPFRNLDLKNVANGKPSSSSSSGMRKKTPPAAVYAQPNNAMSSNTYKRLSQGRQVSPVESIKSADRHYVATNGKASVDTNMYPSSSISLPITKDHNSTRSTSGGTKSNKSSSVMVPRKIEQPASMMAASEVHERFDIRRALARSDAGDEEDDRRGARHESLMRGGKSIDEEDTFGALASTATQAFSKWFG